MGDLSENFSRVEFACRCGCGFDGVDPALIDLLEKTRALYGQRMVVTSGCRCESHNQRIGGSLRSQHVKGRAADIAIAGTGERYHLARAFLGGGALGVGIAKGFVHGDVGIHQPCSGVVRPALWTY